MNTAPDNAVRRSARPTTGQIVAQASTIVLGSLSDLRLSSDSVVDGRSDALLASEVSLGGLDRDVTEKELDLFQFAAGSVPKPRAVSTQIMRRQFLDPGSLCELTADMPDNLSVIVGSQSN
jgi:hypothetical protein